MKLNGHALQALISYLDAHADGKICDGVNFVMIKMSDNIIRSGIYVLSQLQFQTYSQVPQENSCELLMADSILTQ